ncbi:long-chain-fatty-acid--CoA ligase [Shouchella lonarensis]|uniref:Long-chain acyl-CoA synthetase n=1 Tax=Shouchella lonarensis TaxID=1464122 RepID=A0A1G6K3F2_9BACI|nr:long-chain-fatty-acid--CoA ligase [Shouchella lonarensis]SDC25530.1 long-chain acyl-CoA synthetase [Shouchella lonarensis]
MESVQKRWVAHYPESVKESMEYEALPMHAFFKRTTEKYPNQEAVHFLGKKMTFGTLYEQTLRFANRLKALGVKKGDRVAIMSANCPQAVIGYYATLMVGGVVVQTNPLYVERELEHQLNDSGAKVLICLDLVMPRVRNVRSKTPVETVIVTSIKDYLPFPKNLLFPLVQEKKGMPKVKVTYDERTLRFTQMIKEGQVEEANVVVEIDDLALLQYTGGTTGPAKGVMLTHRNLVVNTQQSKAWLYKTNPSEERILGALPFFHVYGMTAVMNQSILTGAAMVLVPKFNPEEVLKTIEKQRITLFPGAPTMYVALINHPDIGKYDLSSIKACLSGSAPLPLEVQETFEEITKGRIVEGYGLTETSPIACANPVWDKRKPGSVGIPWPDTEVMIYSVEKDGEADIGEVGEIWIKGPQVMSGYWNRPEATAQVFHGEWFRSGDMGRMDEEGYVYIVDRQKELIIAGGFNIYPREVEEVLYSHPAVMEAAVIGVPDEYRGETVKAFIVLKPEMEVTEKDLETYCRKSLAAFKIPRLYEFREELPKTLVGKILKRALIEEEMNQKEGTEKKEA